MAINDEKIKLTKREKTLTKNIEQKAKQVIDTFKKLSYSPHSVEKMLLREINIPKIKDLKKGQIEEVTLIKGRLKRITINVSTTKLTFSSYVFSREGNLISCYVRRKGV